uniref:Uncharacterized protein n=1 Tax=Candidatus Kentrum sp. SD TaxID=2126332 RepID=A0A451BQY3_9GAMM|nr:MAG: hypothetical protein BECKSD772D_GA0070982_11436 [Candidatus Kentron sp. SD]
MLTNTVTGNNSFGNPQGNLSHTGREIPSPKKLAEEAGYDVRKYAELCHKIALEAAAKYGLTHQVWQERRRRDGADGSRLEGQKQRDG